jgi:hypothetical protein
MATATPAPTPMEMEMEEVKAAGIGADTVGDLLNDPARLQQLVDQQGRRRQQKQEETKEDSSKQQVNCNCNIAFLHPYVLIYISRSK